MEPKWYVIRTFSGHENKVKNFIDAEMRENEKLRERIVEILVPVEKVYEVKDGKKRTKTRNFYPGYVLLNAVMDPVVQDFVLTTPSVMGFLGKNKYEAEALHSDEVKRIIGRIKQEEEGERMGTIFRNGDHVKIIDGPFNNFGGVVEEVNEERMKVKVMVSIFGRKTPIEIDFVQAELEK